MRREDAVIVTGATSGIGRAVALELHRRGQLVYATGRDTAALAELRGRGLRTQPLDVTDAAAVAGLVTRLAADGVRARVLVNNAGHGQMGPLAELDPDALRRQLEVNTVAPLALVQALLDDLVAHGDGRVVNVSSVSGDLATPFAGAYCASKAALTSLSDVLRLELAPLGVAVITLRPGHVTSRFGDRAAATVAAPSGESRYAAVAGAVARRAQASQHGATPVEDVARAAVDVVLAARPRRTVPLARGGRSLSAFGRLAPAALRDRVLARRYELAALRPAGGR
ncbi:SDR family oxidoreductase [Rhodococcus aerolatus]